jgi:hypothetical protein
MLRYLITALLPLCFVLLSVGYRQMAGPYSTQSINPEYIYFISGLSMGNGIPDVAHVDNPGTPLQVLAALVFRLFWLVADTQLPFTDFVLLNSDACLGNLNFCLSLLLGLALWVGGWVALKITRKVPVALLLQSMPMVPGLWFAICGRVTPELLFPLPAMWISLFILKNTTIQRTGLHHSAWLWFRLWACPYS